MPNLNFDYHQPEKPNTGDKISDALGEAANLTEALNQSGVKTGKTGFFIRLGSIFAGFGARLFGRKK
ncbi:hypothetical protein AB3R30_19810 [Leptolyngbyaceae cyanobacterium UHCC 1019]